MKPLTVMGMDPSLSNWGWARGQYGDDIQLDQLGLVATTRNKDKQVRNNSKDLLRAKSIYEHIQQVVTGAALVFVEVPHGSQSARAMASYGICVGLLGAMKAQGVNIIEVTAKEVKTAWGVKANAPKGDIIELALEQYPDLNWPRYKQNGQYLVTYSAAEHMADAIGAIKAGVNTDQFKQLLAVL